MSYKNMPKKTIESLQKCQRKLLKVALCLKTYCRKTPLLQDMNIKGLSQSIGESQRDFMKSLAQNEMTKILFIYNITGTM